MFRCRLFNATNGDRNTVVSNRRTQHDEPMNTGVGDRCRCSDRSRIAERTHHAHHNLESVSGHILTATVEELRSPACLAACLENTLMMAVSPAVTCGRRDERDAVAALDRVGELDSVPGRRRGPESSPAAAPVEAGANPDVAEDLRHRREVSDLGCAGHRGNPAAAKNSGTVTINKTRAAEERDPRRCCTTRTPPVPKRVIALMRRAAAERYAKAINIVPTKPNTQGERERRASIARTAMTDDAATPCR